MSYEAEAAAIRARFYAEWGDATPVAWPNVPFDPSKVGGNPEGAPAPAKYAWVRLTILPAAAQQVGGGAPGVRCLRYVGQVTVQVFVPENTGDNRARALAEQACTIFRGVTAGGIRYAGLRGEAPRTRTIGNDDAGYFAVNAEIPYQRDDTF